MYIGKILSIKDNIIYCTNTTSNSFIGEVVIFNKKETTSIEDSQLCEGCFFEASASNCKILLLQGEQQSLCIGDEIYGTSKTIRIKVAHHVIDRKKVSKPLLTGINSIDCLFPIGLGQRQLIIGDNNTGKTSLAVSAIINQREFNKNSKSRYNKYNKFTYFKPCIYVLIGQKRSEVIRIQNKKRYYSIFITTGIQYQATKKKCPEAFKPIVYNMESKTDSEKKEEVEHIKHSYSFRSEANTLLKDKRIHSRKGVNESYYVVLAPTDTRIILRHLPVINESIIDIHDSSKKGQIITYYKLTKNNLIYQSTFYKNDTTHSNIPLNVKKIAYMSSEEKCTNKEFF
jgi:hypothetical protein